MAKKLILLGLSYMGAAIMFVIWATGVSWLTVTLHSAVFTTLPRETLEVMVWVSFAISLIITKALLLIATSDVYRSIKKNLGMQSGRGY